MPSAGSTRPRCARSWRRCEPRRQAGMPSDDLAAAITSVEGQLASADRLKELSAQTAGRLRLTQTRLDELVARAAEVSIGAGDTDAYANDVDDLVIEIEAMRLAVEDTRTRMIAKRLGAIALAVILILGAWIVRDRVIDDDGGSSGDDDPPTNGPRDRVLCQDLRDACAGARRTTSISTIRIEDAGDDARRARGARGSVGRADLAHAWRRFPTMVDDAPRRSARRPPSNRATIAGCIVADRARGPGRPTRDACRRAVAARCGGRASATPPGRVDGHRRRPSVARLSARVRTDRQCDRAAGRRRRGCRLLRRRADRRQRRRTSCVWARRLGARRCRPARRPAVPRSQTIQTRPSALDIAVGAEAELSDRQLGRFDACNTLTR